MENDMKNERQVNHVVETPDQKKILEKAMEIAEKFFGTETDPEQIPIRMESFEKLQRLHPKTFIYTLENKELVSWVVVIPTQRALAEQFLKGDINEGQLLDLSKPEKEYEALYFCSAFTIPEYRRQGYTVPMFKEAVQTIPLQKDPMFFAWLYSEEGKKMNQKLETELGVEIKTKE